MNEHAAIPSPLLERIMNVLADYPSPTTARLMGDIRAAAVAVSLTSPPHAAKPE